MLIDLKLTDDKSTRPPTDELSTWVRRVKINERIFIFKIYFTQLDDVYIILLEWLKYCFPVDIFEINVWIFVNIKIICVFDC